MFFTQVKAVFGKRGYPARRRDLLFVLIFLAIIAVTVVYLTTHKLTRQNIGINTSEKQSEIPKALSDIVSFNKVSPYNIETRSLSDGGTQYLLSFNTSHLFENYEMLKENLIKESNYNLQSDTFGNQQFVLKFQKGKDSLNIVAIPGQQKNIYTINFSLYRRF